MDLWIMIFVLELLTLLASVRGKPAPEPWYGDYIGEIKDLQNVGVKGHVYVVNNTCLQLISFTYYGNKTDCKWDVFFWLDYEDKLTLHGIKLSTLEYGHKAIRKYENARVIVTLPDSASVTEFRSFGLWCPLNSKNFGYVQIPKNIHPPNATFLHEGVKPTLDIATRYKLSTGPILLMDRRTIKIYGFTMLPKAPEASFVVGKGPIDKHTIHKVSIRGGDNNEHYETIPKINNHVKMDFILDLPEQYNLYNIEWLAVWVDKLKTNFGSVDLTNIPDRIPPYVPPLMKLSQQDQPMSDDNWPELVLFGNKTKTTFTFQLGVPGGRRAYAAWNMKSHPAQYVWYVNGQMAPAMWLEKDVTYTFIIEGGDDSSLDHLFNPLYISNDSNGGYLKLSDAERRKVAIYAGLDSNGNPLNTSYGPACVWLERSGVRADDYDSFMKYHHALTLKCLEGKPGRISWTPSSKDPTTILFYQSYTESGMGGRIILSQDVGDSREESVGDFSREKTTKDKIPFLSKKLSQQPFVKDNGRNGVDGIAVRRTTTLNILWMMSLLVLIVLNLL